LCTIKSAPTLGLFSTGGISVEHDGKSKQRLSRKRRFIKPTRFWIAIEPNDLSDREQIPATTLELMRGALTQLRYAKTGGKTDPKCGKVTAVLSTI